jgi:hypothetical protein
MGGPRHGSMVAISHIRQRCQGREAPAYGRLETLDAADGYATAHHRHTALAVRFDNVNGV